MVSFARLGLYVTGTGLQGHGTTLRSSKNVPPANRSINNVLRRMSITRRKAMPNQLCVWEPPKRDFIRIDQYREGGWFVLVQCAGS